MARVKGAMMTRKRRNKMLGLAKGYWGNKSRHFKMAKEQVMKSGRYAYAGRKQKKRDFRQLWITRISAGCKANGMNYSTFMHGLKKAGIDMNRKMLSETAIHDAAAFTALCEKAKAAGARRALRLPVGGAFHSPLMEPAKQELEKAINEAPFQTPTCPIYQNVDAKPYTDPAAIKANLIAQLTAPVRWTYIVKNMLADGVTEFTELGPGTVLQGLIKKVDASAAVESKSTL